MPVALSVLLGRILELARVLSECAMSHTLIACSGTTVAGLRLPEFAVSRGEVLTLDMPVLCDSAEASALILALTGRTSAAGLVIRGKVLSAIGSTDPSRLRAWLMPWGKGPLAVNWLQRRSGISHHQSLAILQRLGILPTWGLRNLAGNPRNLLSLEAAWAGGAQVVVFSTVGCDPSGVLKTYDAISGRLATTAAIELSYAYWTNGQRLRDHFPGGTCLTVDCPACDSLAAVSGQP